ncbi:phosphopantetheine-binding protein [Nonomuraea africana]|uniref:phosphopantetheine-binding protein n=1 Tax=Nonomuraea africana TaxID=46171 RepID=UPI0033C01081
MSETEKTILELLPGSGILPDSSADLTVSQDLWQAGMNSLASVRLLVLVEEHFNIEIPDKLLVRSTLASVQALAVAVDDVLQGQR